jgi:hypothetical protein
MRHTFSQTFQGEEAKGTFESHFRRALQIGGIYFEFCEHHAEEELEIEIHRSIDADGADNVTYYIAWEDGLWDDGDDEYDADDDPDSPLPAKEADVDFQSYPFFSCPSLGLTAVILPNPAPSVHGL